MSVPDTIFCKCSRSECNYVTSEPYRYCPQCGTYLTVWVNDDEKRSVLSDLGPVSDCPMASECWCLDNYDSNLCEENTVPQRCLSSVLSILEGIRHDLRQIQSVQKESGLPAPQCVSASHETDAAQAKNKLRRPQKTHPV